MSNMEIGIDCIDITRFDDEKVFTKRNLTRIFTEKEIDFCQKMQYPAQHYAVRFAGKEAVQKALTEYHIDLSLNQIEILNKKNGKPFVQIGDDKIKNLMIKISLSHSKTTAIAVALIVKK